MTEIIWVVAALVILFLVFKFIAKLKILKILLGIGIVLLIAFIVMKALGVLPDIPLIGRFFTSDLIFRM